MGDHYVPRYYLKGFCPESTNNIWVFDKKENTSYQTQVKSTANQNNFYTDYLEKHLTEEIENPANEVLSRIWDMQLLTANEKLVFSQYIYKLIKRVPKGKEKVESLIPDVALSLNKELHQEIDDLVKENPTLSEMALLRKAEIDSILKNRMSGSKTNEIWYQTIMTDSPNFIHLLSSMKWIFWVQDNCTFLTSDNPVFFFESIGIANKNSEVSLPITSNITLWATWREDAVEGYKTPNPATIKEFNRRIASNCSRFIFSQNNEKWIQPFISKSAFHLNRII